MHLSRAQFQELVRQAIEQLPDSFHRYLDRVVVDVEDEPTREVCRATDTEHPSELLGFYEGVPLTEQSLDHPPMLPDRIILYRRNIERTCNGREEIIAEIRDTVLHEIGHHFGLDEDDLEDLGYG